MFSSSNVVICDIDEMILNLWYFFPLLEGELINFHGKRKWYYILFLFGLGHQLDKDVLHVLIIFEHVAVG